MTSSPNSISKTVISNSKPPHCISFQRAAGCKRKKIVPAESRIEQTPTAPDISLPVWVASTGRQVMRSKSDHAWSMATHCAKLAQQAEQKDERDFYIRMRDSWIEVANGLAFLNVV